MHKKNCDWVLFHFVKNYSRIILDFIWEDSTKVMIQEFEKTHRLNSKIDREGKILYPCQSADYSEFQSFYRYGMVCFSESDLSKNNKTS